MASTLRKLADKLEGKDKEHNNPHSSNFGPHSSAAANKVDPLVDSDMDGRNDPASRVGGYGNTQTTTSHHQPGMVGTSAHNTTTGPHNSDLANKLDPRVDSTQTTHVGGHGTHHQPGMVGTSTHNTSTGPHNSDLANKLDPRVDSTQATHYGGHGTSHTTSHHTTGATGLGSTTTTSHHSANTGPHNSNLANKLDPRVDSDFDGRNHPNSGLSGYGNTQTTGIGHGNTHATTGTGYGSTNTGYTNENSHSTNSGPHSSNLLNKLDPRVDSDVDGRSNPTSHVGGYGNTNTNTHQTGLTGHTNTGSHGYTNTNTVHNDPRSTNTGPHSSNLLNKLDPRVDSDRDGRNDPMSRTGGLGNTQTGGVGRY